MNININNWEQCFKNTNKLNDWRHFLLFIRTITSILLCFTFQLLLWYYYLIKLTRLLPLWFIIALSMHEMPLPSRQHGSTPILRSSDTVLRFDHAHILWNTLWSCFFERWADIVKITPSVLKHISILIKILAYIWRCKAP